MARFGKTLFLAPMHMGFSSHLGAAVVAIIAFRFAKGWLDASYAAARHPVDFFTGQTGFDAAQLKAWYATMQAQGTLDIYIRTQIIDFAFIAAFAFAGWMLGTLIARAGQPGGWGRTLGLAAGLALIAGPGMDAAENMISFLMMADPQGFAAPLALIYSGFAVAKFGLITLGMALGAASLLASAGAFARGFLPARRHLA